MRTCHGTVLGRLRNHGLWVAGLVAVALGGTCTAARADGVLPPRSVGVFGDPIGIRTSLAVSPFVPYDLYVLGFELGDMLGYELGITGLDGINVVSVTIEPEGAVNRGSAMNWIVDVGSCLTTETVFRFGTIRILALSVITIDTRVCLRASEPSSFQGLFPGYRRCDSSMEPLSFTYNPCPYPGCLILNSTGCLVATETETWSGVKARYAQD